MSLLNRLLRRDAPVSHAEVPAGVEQSARPATLPPALPTLREVVQAAEAAACDQSASAQEVK